MAKEKFYLPERRANDNNSVDLMEVSENVYREMSRRIYRTRSKAQAHGECVCPRKYLWKCDGVCVGCQYRAAGRNISLDYLNQIRGQEEAGDDYWNPEYIVHKKIVLTQILIRLEELMPEALEVGKLQQEMERGSQRKALEELGINRSTYRSKLERTLKKLKEEFGTEYLDF